MPPSAHQLAEQERRLALVLAVENHGSVRAAATALGVDAASLHRYCAAYRKGGVEALRPATGNAGRKPLADGATDNDRIGIQRLRLMCGSDATALALWADNPGCSPALREAILRARASRHSIPPSLRQLCYVSPEVEALHRGERSARLSGWVQHRDATVIEADGERVAIQPGDLWELDDMSSNFPFWWLDDSLTTRLSEVYGAAVGRQVLFARDVASGKWLGFECVGRPRDAYRATDILSFLRRLFSEHGMPRRGLRLEGGVWRSRVIAGIDLASGLAASERPAMTERERQAVFGGLSELGISVQWCHSPNTKGGIEGGFDHFQTLCAGIAAQLPLDRLPVHLGRTRGEDERGNEALRRAHQGVAHPQELGFFSMDQAAELMRLACVRANGMEKEGKIARGVPDETWARATAADPLKPMPADKLWVFLPHEARVSLRGGHVRATVEGTDFYFTAPETFAALGSGYQVRVRFDPAEPSLGGWIFSDEPATSRRNTEARQPGDFIVKADFAPAAAQFDPGRAAGFESSGKGKFTRAVRTAYRGLGLYGRPAAAADTAADGRGSVRKIERRLRMEPITAPAAEQAAQPNRIQAAAPKRTIVDLDQEEETPRIERTAAPRFELDEPIHSRLPTVAPPRRKVIEV